MDERSHWDDCAAAMELTLEGNRLIVLELACYLRSAWQSVLGWLDETARVNATTHRLPPL